MTFPDLPADGVTPWGDLLRAWADAIEAAMGTGTGVEEVSGTVTLAADGPRLRQFYTVGASVIGGETFAVDTALVARRTAAGTWQVAAVDGAEWRAFSSTPLTSVTASGATWTDDTANGGGTWSTPTETGVTYTPASGTATPGQSVTVTATAQAGYTITGTTSWSHTFPTASPYASADVFDTFTYADNYRLQYQSNALDHYTEGGGIKWEQASLPLLGLNANQNNEAVISGGKISGDHLVSGSIQCGSTLNLAQTSVRMEADYDLTGAGSSISLAIAGSTSEAFIFRVFQTEGLKLFQDGTTQVGATVPLATLGGATGRLAVEYNAATGALTAWVDDVEKFTASGPTGRTGTRAALAVSGTASGQYGKLDNLAVIYL